MLHECFQEDAEETAARKRLSRLSTRNSASQNSAPQSSGLPAASSSASGLNRQSAASSSGRHIAPPKLSQDDSWAAELDNDDSWDSLDHKPSAGESMCLLKSWLRSCWCCYYLTLGISMLDKEHRVLMNIHQQKRNSFEGLCVWLSVCVAPCTSRAKYTGLPCNLVLQSAAQQRHEFLFVK